MIMRNMNLPRAFSFLFALVCFTATMFAQTITIDTISDATPCAGDTITVACTASQVMGSNNIYQIEISDTADNFSNPVVIGTLATTDANVIITGVVPSGILQDNLYMLRVISSAPAVVSSVESIYVEQNPGITAGSNSPVLSGQPLQLTANSDAGSTYFWLHPDGVSTSTLQNPVIPTAAASDAGTFTVEVTGANGCKNAASFTVEVNVYTITIPVVEANYCDGATATFNFVTNRNFDAQNVFTAQLSDLTGNFDNPIVIGESHDFTSGVMHVTFPSGLAGGSGYRIRIVASNPGIISESSSQFYLRPIPQPYVHASGPLTFCEGQSVTFTAYNGAQYLWSNGSQSASITASQTGNYMLTMTDQFGCVGTALQSVVVHSPNHAYIVNVGSTQLCEGESVRLVAYDGASYAWSNGAFTQSIIVDEAGSYNVTVTNSYGCAKAATAVDVTVVSLPDVTVSQGEEVEICTGESVTIALTEGYQNYFWNTGNSSASITVSEEGDYSAMVFDYNGCSIVTEPVHVTVHDAPSTPEITYNSGMGELFCTEGQFYQWYKDGVAIDGAVYHHLLVRGVNGLEEGTYTVEVSNVHGCSKMSSTYELFEVISGITQKEKRILSLYPNPNNGIFELDIPRNSGVHIVVTNSVGSIVYDAENKFERSQIDLTHLKSGVYFLKAFDETGVSSVMFMKH